ncbi:MAG TPA: ABC transporter ATP-binding protein [Verrucomicrobiae bacterium]|nr:ABC transporter ATP-binding protein [Verrucomicrobiae bacterium]
MNTAVEIRNVSVVLGGSFTALHDIDVELPAGKITGFIGPSGAGKTTLVRSIVGRQRIAAGSISVFGEPAGSVALRPQLGYMTQETAIYTDLTVRQNLRYFATMSGARSGEAKRLVMKTLKDVDMTGHADQLCSKLSGGQKQRVSLAIALIGHPRLLVLDEPTVGLDPVLREQIWKLFRKLTDAGATIIITSHVMDEAGRCDDLLLIRNGQILAHDSPVAFCARTKSETVEQGFLKLVEQS